MSIEVTEVIGPSCWASYLINGDASGMDQAEIDACDAWQQEHKPAYCVDTKRDKSGEGEESWFTGLYWLYGGNASGGDVLTYIFHRQRRKYARKAKIGA